MADPRPSAGLSGHATLRTAEKWPCRRLYCRGPGHAFLQRPRRARHASLPGCRLQACQRDAVAPGAAAPEPAARRQRPGRHGLHRRSDSARWVYAAVPGRTSAARRTGAYYRAMRTCGARRSRSASESSGCIPSRNDSTTRPRADREASCRLAAPVSWSLFPDAQKRCRTQSNTITQTVASS